MCSKGRSIRRMIVDCILGIHDRHPYWFPVAILVQSKQECCTVILIVSTTFPASRRISTIHEIVSTAKDCHCWSFVITGITESCVSTSVSGSLIQKCVFLPPSNPFCELILFPLAELGWHIDCWKGRSVLIFFINIDSVTFFMFFYPLVT